MFVWVGATFAAERGVADKPGLRGATRAVATYRCGWQRSTSNADQRSTFRKRLKIIFVFLAALFVIDS